MGPCQQSTYQIQFKSTDHQTQLEILIVIVAVVSSTLEAITNYCASWTINFNISYSETFRTQIPLNMYHLSCIGLNVIQDAEVQLCVCLFICVIIWLMLLSSLGCKLQEGKYHICCYHFIPRTKKNKGKWYQLIEYMKIKIC